MSRALIIAAFFLVASAMVRMGANMGSVLAGQEEGQYSVGNGDKVAEKAKAVDDSEVDAVLMALSQREARLNERETHLEAKILELETARQSIETRLSELKSAESELRQTIDMVDGASERDLEKLTAVYENMKVKSAIPLFEKMDAEFAAGFLARMKPEVAAGILSGLTPEVAYSVSAILAGRNVMGPKN